MTKHHIDLSLTQNEFQWLCDIMENAAEENKWGHDVVAYRLLKKLRQTKGVSA